MDKIKKASGRIIILGVVGTIAGIGLCFLEACQLIKFPHFERFPFWRETLIISSNHPATRETYLIPLMFFPWWFRKFLKPYPLPISTPDKKNFPYFKLLKDYCIFVDRSKKAAYKRGKALLQMRDYLKEGANIILFIEGTRTEKATKKIASPQGKEMGVPMTRLGYLVKETGASIVPVWVETSWKCPPNSPIPFFLQAVIDFVSLLFTRTKIRAGQPLKFNMDESEEEIVQKTIQAMFQLADEK